MTFYFYDLETSGIDAKFQRIMQFGGQRTDENFNPIEEPFQTLVKLSDDTLPEPEAVLVTGITPQMTNQEGISEVALAKHLNTEVFTDDTVVVGYNSIRFDDEFIRNLLYRNYYDPYEREWSNGRSRWDIIDLVRMTRALRPDGIKWPLSDDGKPTNRLELLTKENGIEHSNAHDALADVEATISLTKILKDKQPKLFAHMLEMRDKKKVAQLVYPGADNPVVHTSGMLASENFSTSVFIPLIVHPVNKNAILSWDLRHDPANWKNYSVDELKRLVFSSRFDLKADEQRLPIKAIHLNKSPAVAPLGVLDEQSQERINLNIKQIESNLRSLQKSTELTDKLSEVWQADSPPEIADVDGKIYNGFIPDSDKILMKSIHGLNEAQLRDYRPKFSDKRLQDLWLRYKARNFASTLSDEERTKWESYRANKINKGPGINLSTYMNKLAKLADQYQNDSQKISLLEDLQLYAESIVPYENQTLI